MSAHRSEVSADVSGTPAVERAIDGPLDRWFLILVVIFAIPLIVSIFTGSALSWDGAFYLFRTLDDGVPYVVHDRFINAPLQWPVLWVNAVTDSLPVLRATFGTVHVITPIVALTLSWWVVRAEAPALIIWPCIGIGLATLPGQLFFVSEGIKAHQLAWPVLLAILVGLPTRTIPMVAVVSLVMLYLHPTSAAILGFIAAVAIIVGHLQPCTRERLYPLAGCLALAALLRYGMVTNQYETSEMNLTTLKRQWRSTVVGLPGIALALSFTVALLLIAVPIARPVSRRLQLLPIALVAFAGGALTIWALDPARWWNAYEFRGPANIASFVALGFGVADALLATRVSSDRLDTLPAIRRRTGQAIAVTFAIVLSIQSFTFGRVVEDMNNTLASSGVNCIESSDLPDMPESPLNLWPTPSLALLYQGWKPTRAVLPDGGCTEAREDGTLYITSLKSSYQGNRFDLLPLRWELSGHGECWWDEPSGWHKVERTEIGRRRWSPDTGVIRILVGKPAMISFRGTVTSLKKPNTVVVKVNGVEQQTIEFSASREVAASELKLQLREGENIVEFVSENAASHAPGDPRPLAFSLLNVKPVLTDATKPCALHG